MKTGDKDEFHIFDAASHVQRPLTPAQCRSEIERMRYGNPLVHRVLTVRDMQGISGEDIYSLLAYHALKQLEDMTEQNLDLLKRIPPQFP